MGFWKFQFNSARNRDMSRANSDQAFNMELLQSLYHNPKNINPTFFVIIYVMQKNAII